MVQTAVFSATDISGWKIYTNMMRKTRKTSKPRLCVCSGLRASRIVVFVFHQAAACIVKSEAGWLPQTTLGCFMCSGYRGIIHSEMQLGDSASNSLHRRRCKASLLFNVPAKWLRQENENSAEGLTQTSLSLMWYSDLTDGKIAMVYQNGRVG